MFDHQLYLQTGFYFFNLLTIEPVELLVAKSYYSIGLSVAKSSNILSVAKSSNILSVAKSRTVELSVAKNDVRRYLSITTASLSIAWVCQYNL
jgi:hypothetical protein